MPPKQHRGSSERTFCLVCRCRHTPGVCNRRCENCSLRHNGACKWKCHNCGVHGHTPGGCSLPPLRPLPRACVESWSLKRAGLYRWNVWREDWDEVGYSAHHAQLFAQRDAKAQAQSPPPPPSRSPSPPPPPPPSPPSSARPASPSLPVVGVKRRRFVTDVVTTTREVGVVEEEDDSHRAVKLRRIHSPEREFTSVERPERHVKPVERTERSVTAPSHHRNRSSASSYTQNRPAGAVRGSRYHSRSRPRRDRRQIDSASWEESRLWREFNARRDDQDRSNREQFREKLRKSDEELGWTGESMDWADEVDH